MNRKRLLPPALLAVGLLLIVLTWPSLSLRFGHSNQLASDGSDTRPALHILFIGNSYTFVNDLPRLVTALAAGEDRPVNAESVTEGGATLGLHWQKGAALAAIRRGNWDYVVLQEQSTLGSSAVVNGIAQINDPGDFYRYARLFDAEIKKVGSKTLFYLTWARQNAPQTQAALNNAYRHIAGELRAQVVPVGVAWASALQTRPGLVLHQDDLSHPNSAGSYLAACVFYATIYHKSPVGLTPRITDTQNQALLVNLNDSDAALLQTVAWNTVLAQDGPSAQLSKTASPVVSHS